MTAKQSSPYRGNPGFADYGLLVLVSAVWGSSFLFIKIGVADLPAIPFTTLRLILGAAVMLAIARYMRERIFGIGLPWSFIWLSGFFGNALPFMLIGWGEERIDSGLAAILMAVSPLATVLLAHVYTRDDRLTAGKVVGVVLGILGIVVLIGPSKITQIGGDVVRQLAVAAAAVCYGINVLITREIQRRTSAAPTALVAAVILASALIMIPFQVLLASPVLSIPSWPSFTSALVMAVFHTAAATILMFVLIERQGPSFFAQVNFLVPVFGVAWGILVLAERPEWTALLALALILLGMAAARRRTG
ncbi:MAG: putative amino-acid metabolite efflux pump [Pseudomonadota bacterium]|jgi:drug/metabolite transporter (DMT)-like permease